MARVIPGNLKVSNDCIADLAGYAALECYGVVGMAVTDQQEGVTRLLPMQRLRRGIQIRNNEDTLDIDLYIVVQYGTNISTVAENLAETVRYALEEYLQVSVNDISVNIQGVKA